MQTTNNIIAHRGVHDNKEIPENSLLAFKTALKYNYSIELDVQLTKDNILIVFHDYDLNRMTNKTDLIQNLTYKEIQEISLLNTTEKIPTLKEVLKLINSKVLLDIEIKNTKKIKETCEILVNELKEYNNFILKSFNPLIVKYLKKNFPQLEVGYLITDHYNNHLYDKLLTSSFIINYIKSDFLSINKRLLQNTKFMKKINHKKILIWTIINKEELINKDYLYICNNLPFN